MTKILETKSLVNGGYIQLIRIRKTFRTERVEEDGCGWKTVRKHRTLDGALKRFSKFGHNPRPFTSDEARKLDLYEVVPNSYWGQIRKSIKEEVSQELEEKKAAEKKYWEEYGSKNRGLPQG